MTDQLTRILATLKDGKATCDLPKADKRTLNEWLARKIDPENEQGWVVSCDYCHKCQTFRGGSVSSHCYQCDTLIGKIDVYDADENAPDFALRPNAHWLEVWLVGKGLKVTISPVFSRKLGVPEHTTIERKDSYGCFQTLHRHPDHNTALILAAGEVDE